MINCFGAGFMGRFARMIGIALQWSTAFGGLPPVTQVDLPCAEVLGVYRSHVLFDVWEHPSLGEASDLNGDGDTEDRVLHLYDNATGKTVNTGLSGALVAFDDAGMGVALDVTGGTVSEEQNRIHIGRYALIYVSEAAQGQADLNGDGDAEDLVPHVVDLVTLEHRNLGVVPAEGGVVATSPWVEGATEAQEPPPWIAHALNESRVGEDLNGDTDLDDVVLEILNLATGEMRTLSLVVEFPENGTIPFKVSYPWIAYLGPGGSEWDYLPAGDYGADLVLHCYNIETGVTTHLARSVIGFSFSYCIADWLVWGGFIEGVGGVPYGFDLRTGETKQLSWEEIGSDFCSAPGRWQVFDGRSGVQVHDRTTGESWSLGFSSGGWGTERIWYLISGHWLVLVHSEERVVFVHNLETLETINTTLSPMLSTIKGAAAAAFGDWVIVTNVTDGARASALFDLETRETTRIDLGELFEAWDLKRSQTLAALCVGTGGRNVFEVLGRPGDHLHFLRGDPNADSAVDISDPVRLLGWLFLGALKPECLAASDANGDGTVDISDASYLLGFLFLGGPPPGAPFPECGGAAPESDARLGCESSPADCR